MDERNSGEPSPDNWDDLEKNESFQGQMVFALGSVVGQKLFGKEGYSELMGMLVDERASGGEMEINDPGRKLTYEQFKKFRKLISHISNSGKTYKDLAEEFESNFNLTVEPEDIQAAKKSTVELMTEQADMKNEEE